MTQTQNRPGPAKSEAAEQVGETGSQSTHLPDAWHQQTEWEGQWHYADGYAAGYAAAERAIANEITEALGVQPLEPRKVIRWLVAGVGVVRKGTPR